MTDSVIEIDIDEEEDEKPYFKRFFVLSAHVLRVSVRDTDRT
jgi:hypothetical protein